MARSYDIAILSQKVEQMEGSIKANDVIANPTGETTGDLTAVQIDGSKYKVSNVKANPPGETTGDLKAIEIDGIKLNTSPEKVYTGIAITNSQGGTETSTATLYTTGNLGYLDFTYTCQSATSETLSFDLPTGWCIQRGGITLRDNDNGALIGVFCNPIHDIGTYGHTGTMTSGHKMWGSAMCYKAVTTTSTRYRKKKEE